MILHRTQATHLTPIGEKLLQIIQDAGEAGTTRPQLAKALGKKRLHLYHDVQLFFLEDQGYISVNMHPNARLVQINEFVYRTIETKAIPTPV